MTAGSEGHTLVLEASTYAGSVALLRGVDVVAERDVEMRGRDEERLMPAVAECVARMPDGLAGVRRLVCGAGPGSFTSLRIAASIAKGICHARGIPLFAVSSLALIVAGSDQSLSGGRFMASLDAMRGEAFAALFEATPDDIVAVGPVRIVATAGLANEARIAGGVMLAGAPHARHAARMLDAVVRAGPVDLGSWEPDYGRSAEAQVKWEAAHGRPLPR
ncbi:MAG TPA: tRNA (adenosine(37)-N6)-threonylcarbamoyltransferase complex dimerization subunit type 1 TsaB [Gemmatimonadaceae bacterium]|nr:tRNA (adenosine(37)-N6)-threonylcarbamoyltransferase complex dimerization subunit type 1 TsaB [Gemmatimonadaceae bacterium]